MSRLIFIRLFTISFLAVAAIISLATHEEQVSGVSVPPPSQNDWVNTKLKLMSLEEKIGQFFMVAAFSNRGEEHFRSLDSVVTMNHIGGLIFFQGNRLNFKSVINRFQGKAKIPLLIGMDAEWGIQMRLFGEKRYPYNYTLGAADDPKLTRKISEMIAQECREIGIHMNFSPVADVNSNPDNPVIGFRSYGENPARVSAHVKACVQGMESQGILTSIKHFPGHGDTEMDSHYDLPLVENSYQHIDAIDFAPFRAGIKAGASSVMIGHLNVPALDSTGTPSSLSSEVIKRYLQEELGFSGLVISDALNMKSVSDRYGKTEVVVKAFQAGCDILLFPESVSEAIAAIRAKVESGEISQGEIDARCRKVLNAKYKSIISPKKYKTYSEFEIEFAKKQVYEKAIVVLKNENEALPIKRFDQRIAHVSIGKHVNPMNKAMDLVAPIDHFQFFTLEEASIRLKDSLTQYDMIITAFHCSTVRPRNDYGLPNGWKDWLQKLPESKKILVVFGNPLGLQDFDDSSVDAVLVGYENHEFALDRMGQFIMGTYASEGKLPFTVSEKYPRDHGIEIPWAGRLKESQPEELGISRSKLREIDRIAERGISSGAYPGCQVVVAIEGKIIMRKSYGHHTYDNKRKVQNTDLYDIASITKVAASTASLMVLNSRDQFSLNSRLGDHLPVLTDSTPYARILMKDILTHQAGLVPWIPFYVKTLTNRRPGPKWYAPTESQERDFQVSENLWINSAYTDIIYQRILSTPLKAKRYKYSDLGYYFVRKIVQKKSAKPLDQFAMDELYLPMGLKHLRYNPLDYFTLRQITPTENDTIFRKELVHGFVHDQGAAMIGGVGGHAGLFSNATDLASLMQLFLNKGSYGGVQYIDPAVISEYTSCQYCPNNRRGAGFDKPTVNGKGGPTTNKVSRSSFGHSGFTGTLCWADPVYEINYVFLSNRVYPIAENWKIVSMNIRTDIQRVIYEALEQARE